MKNDLKRKYIQFRATGPEVWLLNYLAFRLGLNKSEMLRELIREAAEKLGLPDPASGAYDDPPVNAKSRETGIEWN